MISTLSMGANREDQGPNKTPGDDVGSDHTGFSFNCYQFAGTGDGGAFAKHVGTGGSKAGQQYAISEYVQTSSGTNVPAPCTVLTFYNIIHHNKYTLAVLLLNSHGGNNSSSIEPFEKTPAGKAARDARYQAYLNGNVSGCPAFTASEIYKSANHDAWAVGITDEFIRNHGNMNQSLAYVASCYGSSLTDDFVAAGSRVSVGYTDSVFMHEVTASIKKFFARMDGQEGIANRPVARAMVGLPATLGSTGNTATTLTPAVKKLDAPCPINVGDTVTYTLDTDCEQGITPNIDGFNVTIENEIWLSKTELQGTCTAIGNPTSYSLILEYDKVYSDQNVALLDGNLKPFLVNAHGPAHDSYWEARSCPTVCVADMNGDSVVDIADLLALLEAWGTNNPAADLDGNGIVNIADLLVVLGGWGQPCTTGSCCLDDYCIDEVTSDDCYEMGGSYRGDETVCKDEYECVTIGSCCFTPYECEELVTEAECDAWGGTFGGNDSTCEFSDCWVEPIGGCCYDSYSCVAGLTLIECEYSGGYFLGIDSDCTEECPFFDPGGACCIESSNGTECIELVLEEDCAYLNGIYNGAGTTCDSILCEPLGACCVTVGSTPSCMDAITEDLCEDGSWYEGATCEDINWECTPPWGACCLADVNACWDVFSQIECNQVGGTFYENETCNDVNCQPSTGACCVMNDCTLSTPEDCLNMGGDFYSAGTDCASMPCEEPILFGACCITVDGGPDCYKAYELQCNDLGGSYMGDESVCEPGVCDQNPPASACCWMDGTCSDNVGSEDCTYAGGFFYATNSCIDAPCDVPVECPNGEIEDCNGNCFPANWVGDGICDDATTWDAVFNCPEFNCDGGDCPPENCGG